MDAVVAEALAGRGGALVVRGEAGIGKSTLLSHARERAAGAAIVEASGVETEAELAFSRLGDVLRPALPRLDELTNRQARALRAALGLDDSVAADRLTVGGATLALLAAHASERPLVVLIDDAHWLDAESRAALTFTARRLAADPIAMVFAARDEEGATLDAAGIPELRLDGLADADALQLLAARGASADVARQMVAQARGNPLALLELPARATSEQLEGTVPLENPIRVGPAIEAAFAHRVFRLGEDGRQALVAVAADDLGDDALLAVALERLGVPRTTLDDAEDAGLIARSSGSVSFRHPLVRSAVYHGAAPTERRRAHAALASAYSGVDVDRSAWHLAAAAVGVDREAAGALASSAARARARGGYQAAAAAFERAARLTPPGASRAQLVAEAADAALAAGRLDSAQRLVDEGLSVDELDPRTRSSLLGVAARIALHGGNQRRAFDAFLEAATLAAPWDADRAAELRADAVVAAVQLGGDAPAIAAAELEAHGDLDDPWTAVVVSQARGSAASMSGAAGARALIERAVELSETASPESAQQLYLTGRSNFMLGRNNAAAELARQALAQARRDDASRIVVETLRLLAGAEFDRGHWRDAYAAAAEAVELAEEIGLPRDACAALGILAEVDAGAGNGLACAEHAARAIELGAEFDLGFYRARAERASGQLALATGRHEEAAAELERVWKEQLETGSQEWSVTPVFDLIEALVRLGRREEARDVLVRARAELPPESPVEQGIFDRCAALLEEDFEPLFDRALAAHALEEFVDEFPFEHARVRLAYGTRLRRAGRRREARAQLEAAHEAFQEIGAGAWAEQASAELRASGARRRAGDVSREHLTPREQQIAVAVAEGASNREVAAQLFLTPKTVEYHLTRVYRKLGVRTRVELVRLLSRPSGSQLGTALERLDEERRDVGDA